MEDMRLILSRHGFSFKKQFGQNFISDTNLLKSIVALAGVDKDTAVLEIGCGAGTLTRELSRAAKSVVGYEIDKNLQPVLAETLSGCENTEVVFRDFLKEDMKALEREMPPYTVVANLPYYITSPLVMKFVEESEKAEKLVIMVQDDVAKRFCAKAGTPEYGAITAAIALRGSCRIVRRVPRTMFIPRPNVDSAVVRIDIREGNIAVKDAALYKKVVRAAFSSRRKTLENNLMQAFRLGREEVQRVLSGCGVQPMARGEELSPQTFAALADSFLSCGIS